MTTNFESSQPTPAQIDALVRKLDRLIEQQKPSAKQQQAAKDASDARMQLMVWAQEFGEVPKSAPASLRLSGNATVLTVTTGTTTKEHPEVVGELLEVMTKNGHKALFATLFTPSTRYDRAKDALNNLKNAELSKPLRKLYDSIFARTQSSGPRAPVLRIDKAA